MRFLLTVLMLLMICSVSFADDRKGDGMEIEGVELSARAALDLVFKREGKPDIHLKVGALQSIDEFDSICPEPAVPVKFRKGKAPQPQPGNSIYVLKKEQWQAHKTHWIIWNSLLATPGLKWKTVLPDDPKTWGNALKELVDAGFNLGEQNEIGMAVLRVNGLLEEDLAEEAEGRFFPDPQREEVPEPSGPSSPSTTGEQPDT